MRSIVYSLFLIVLFYNSRVLQAKSIKSSNSTITTRVGQVNKTGVSSTSSQKVVLFRVGAQDSRQQRCRCVLFYLCDNINVVDVTSPEFLNESDIVCALGSEVCCREPIGLPGQNTEQSPVTQIITELPSSPPTVVGGGDSSLLCVCVPRDQCAVGDPETVVSGAGKLDIRFTECAKGDICCFPDEIISSGSPIPLGPPTPTQQVFTDESPVTPTQPTFTEISPVTDIIQPGQQVVCGVRNLYKDSLNTRIISPPGVSDTVFGEFPWMAVIVRVDIEDGMRHENVFQCGASFISRSFILTAAHCVHDIDISRLKIRVGEYNTRFGVKREPMPHQDSNVSGIIIHPQFNPRTMFNDIAIITVESAFNITSNANPICLPANNMLYNPNSCIATGWGQNSMDDGGRFQDTLKKVELRLVPNNECEQKLRQTRLGKYFKLDPSFVCAGGQQGADTCKGDGGGPLVCELVNEPNRYVQVGIVSWGIGCGDEIPAVYASIEANKEWLDRELSALTFGGVFRIKS